MSDDWVITPPCSPISNLNQKENSKDINDINCTYMLKDWNERIFYCLGEPHSTNQTFHKESYLLKNDIHIFYESNSNVNGFIDNFDELELFGHKFDKGSALIKHTNTIFKMAKYFYMQLDWVAKSNVNSLSINLGNKKITNPMKYREDIVSFLLYIRNYIRRVSLCSKYKWIAENLFINLNKELNSFLLLCGSISNIPDYIVNYSSSNNGNKCNQPAYHLFHCQLDVKWLHITIMYQLISYKQRLKTDEYSDEYEESLNFDKLDSQFQFVISDLIIIAIKRFQHVPINELSFKSLFTCTCIRELWKLLQLSTDYLHSVGHTMSFWNYVNRICEKVASNSMITAEFNDCSKLSLPQNYECANPTAFTLWLLKHLAQLYTLHIKSDLKNNHQLLENIIKECINSEVPEFDMRVYLNLIENILNIGWEIRTEPFILFWEYFHKRLNSLFFVPGASVSDLAVISKSGLGFLIQLQNKIDFENPEKNTDSFHLYLRLLGRHLRKCQDNSRFWNQLKGRIFSKFSVSKLLTLNEIGLYHFISLFLTLAITADLQEVSGKLISFLKLLPIQEMGENKIKLIWKAHIVILLLFTERNQDISPICNSILDMVETAVSQPESAYLMRIFVEGFQDLIDCTNNLELGQYMFIGNWIPNYLLQCNESDASRFLDSLLSLINKLNSIMSAQLPVSQDNQLILMYNALWEQLVPYVKKVSSNPSSPYQISDIAAVLTILSLKSSFSHCVKKRAIDLFSFFITHDMIDVRLLCRYLGQISRCVQLHHILKTYSITLIKGWLRCLILVSNNDNCNEDLSLFTNYIVSLPEIQEILNETKVTIIHQKDCLENFLIALQLKYSSLQDFHLKNKFVNQVFSYFSNIERWLSYIIKVPSSVTLAMNIYNNVGQMFFKIPHLLYIKSKPNSLLQSFLDLLLLPVQVRNPQFKLNSHVREAIKSTLYLYIHGLYKLDPESDTYVSRSIRELITIYVPRLVTPKGTIMGYRTSQFSLLKCFEFSEDFSLISKSIIEILCSTFIKRRTKTPHQFAFQALIFLNNVVRMNKTEIIKCFIKNAFGTICDVVMFCENMNPCKKEAKDILNFILDMHLVRNDSDIGNDLMDVFSKLCHEHLAFTSRALFDLFEEVIFVAPDLVARFLPQLEQKIKEVEFKRGVGFDRALRKGLEQIQELLKNIKNKQIHNS